MMGSRNLLILGSILLFIPSCSFWRTDGDPSTKPSVVSQGGSTNGSAGERSTGDAGGGTGNLAGEGGTNTAPPKFEFPIPEGAVPLKDWSLGSAQAVCALVDRCMSSLLSWGNYVPFDEPCVAFVANRQRDRLDLESLVTNGQVAYDPEAFGACLTRYAKSNCDDGEPVQCVAQLGLLPEGATCAVDLQCQPNMRCKRSSDCASGTCTLALSEGQDCKKTPSENDPRCRVGLACWNGTCQKPSMTSHGQCNEDSSNCATGLNCVWDELCGDVCYSCLLTTNQGNATCRDGQALDYGLEYPQCGKGLALGDECRSDDDCGYENYCSGNIPNHNRSLGKCLVRAALGQHCDALDPNQSCTLGARCDTSTFTCVEASLAGLGVKCGKNTDCYSDRCAAGECVRPQLCEADLVR